jgi:hypothetical protein
MPKKQNWATLLANTITAAKERPFSWGSNDCCLFAADCALVQTGVDPALLWRGKYKTKLGATRLISRAGGLVNILDSHYKRVNPKHASRGDLVLFDGPNGETVGVFFSGVWAVTEIGAANVDATPKLIWRVE